MAARMAPDNIGRSTAGEGSQSYGARGAGAARDADTGGADSGGGRAGYTPDSPNLGSARSDYGSHAYGGTLNRAGAGGAAVDDYTEGRVDRGSSGYGTRRGRGAGMRAYETGGGTIMALLAGVGIGAALMYLFDPERGNARRAYLRDKCVSAANKTGDVIDKRARDLRNRARGVVAEAGGALAQAGEAIGLSPGGEREGSTAGGTGNTAGAAGRG